MSCLQDLINSLFSITKLRIGGHTSTATHTFAVDIGYKRQKSHPSCIESTISLITGSLVMHIDLNLKRILSSNKINITN